MLHCTVNVNVDGLTERPILRTSRSTISQIDNPGVVIEELSTVFGNFPRNSVGILDVPLAEILQNASQPIIPLLFLFLGLARVGSPKLDEELLTYKPEVSLRTRGGLDKREYKTRC
jgi:hypothetical protein